MSGLIDTCAEMVTELVEAGIRATMDTRNLNPPCTVVTPPSIVLDSLAGGHATYVLYVVAPGPGNADAWRTIDAMAAEVAMVLPIETIDPDQFGVDDTGALPAFRLSLTRSIEWP